MSGAYELDAGGDKKSSPKEMAAGAVQTVKEEVATFADAAQEKAMSRVEEKKDTAADTLAQFAGAIRHAGDELARGDQSLAGRVVKQAADGLETFARSVTDKRPEELFDAVRDFGRRNPGAFVAGALLVGLAAGRFLRSSADHGGAATPSRQGSGRGASSPGMPEDTFGPSGPEPDLGGAYGAQTSAYTSPEGLSPPNQQDDLGADIAGENFARDTLSERPRPGSEA
jgi:hypothetical protein